MSNQNENVIEKEVDESFIKFFKARAFAYEELNKLKPGEKTVIDCPICGEKMLILKSKKGHVIQCGCCVSMS